MQIETLHDVLRWTQEFHRQLAVCLVHCEKRSESERVRLLLKYLAEHETKLADVVERFDTSASLGVLNTWVCEYIERYPIVKHTGCEQGFTGMGTAEIIKALEHQHAQVIGLYRHLQSRVGTPSAQELLESLVSLEEHEAFRMNHGANRLEDL